MGTKALIFEIIGVDKASGTFDKVSTAVAGTTTKMEKMQKVGAIAGKGLAIGLAAAGVAAVSFTKNAVEDDAAQRKLALALKNTTGATKEQDAAVESWISTQGSALGITDDQLRPAFQKLAQATGDITKSQRLAGIAMDTAVGSGKSLEAVTTAMAKAQNGNMGALSKLGVRIKDATGKTLSFNAVTKQMAATFSGQASAAANSTEGRFQRLQVQFDETKETIGYQLIPAAMKLGDILLKVMGFVSQHIKTFEILGGALAVVAASLWLVSLATTAVNIAMEANPIGLIILGLVALGAGLVYAYHHFDTFRKIVDTTFGFLKTYVPPIIKFVVDFVKNHWQILLAVVLGPMGILVGQVIKHFGAIKSAVGSAVSWVVDKARDFVQFEKIVLDHVKNVVQAFKQLPGKIKDFFSGLPGQLATIGGQLIDGLVRGLQAAAHKVTDFVTSLVNKIPKKFRELMGINSPAKVMIPIGEAIPEGIAAGMERASGKVDDAAKKLTDKLKDKLSSLMDARSSLASSVAGAFTGSLFSAQAQAAVLDENGNVVTPAQTVGQNFLSGLHSTSGQLSQLIPAFKQLRKWGWKPGMLATLFQSGGADLIIELAANQSESADAMSSLQGINRLSQHLGNLVGEDVYGDQIDAIKGKGGKGKGGSARREGDTINITVNGGLDGNTTAKVIVQAIKKYKREVEGNRELGIA